MKILILLPLLAVFMVKAKDIMSEDECSDPQWTLFKTFLWGYKEEYLRSALSPLVVVSFCNETLDIEGYVKYSRNLVKDGDIGYSYGVYNKIISDENTCMYTVAMEWSRRKVVHWHPVRWYNVIVTKKNGTPSIDKMTELNCTKTN